MAGARPPTGASSSDVTGGSRRNRRGASPRRPSGASPPARIPPPAAPAPASCRRCAKPSRSISPSGPSGRRAPSDHYRNTVRLHLGDWLDRTLDTISRKDVEQCFDRLTQRCRLGPGQSCGHPAARHIPTPLHRYRGPAQPGGSVARRRRTAQPQAAPTHPAAGRGAAPLEPGHRGRCAQSGQPRRLPHGPLYRHAPRRGSGSALGAGSTWPRWC